MCLASLIAGRQDKLVRQRALKCVHCGPKPLALVALLRHVSRTPPSGCLLEDIVVSNYLKKPSLSLRRRGRSRARSPVKL